MADWPTLPANPYLLTTLEVAVLLRYDTRADMTHRKARRNVRYLVEQRGLPVFGKVGQELRFCHADVLKWVKGNGST